MKITRMVCGAATLALLFIPGQVSVADAAEITVLCSNGLKTVMEDLAPKFERATGHKLIITFGLAARFKQQIEAGEPFDVAVLTPPLIDDLIKQGKVAAETHAVIARTGLGILIRAGARKPDVSTGEAFKRALLDAKSIAYAKEGASGVYFAGLIQKLGITEALKSKTSPTATAEEVGKVVTGGQVELGVLPLSEILPLRGAELGGMFPAEVQSYVVMTAGVSGSARQPNAAKDLIKFLMAPAALPVIKAKGMERD